MNYLGDFALGSTFDLKFVTTAAATGAPTTLSGTPVISAYQDNSTTELTAGVSLTADFDSRTGLNNVRVVASSGNGYASGSNYQLVITTGTVGGTSAVGYVVGEFSIEARSALRPTTAGRTLDVASTGEAGLDLGNISAIPAGAIPALGIVDSGTAQSATGTTLVLRSAAAFADHELKGATVLITGGSTGVGQSALISDNVGSTDTVTVPTWATTPTGTITYVVFGTPANTATTPPTAAAIRTEMDSNSTQLAKLGSPAGASISADIATTNGRLTSTRAGYLDNLSAGAVAQASVMTATRGGYLDNLSAGAVAQTAALATAQTAITGIKAKTDNLPSDPADASDIGLSFSTVNSTLAGLATAAALATAKTSIDGIKAKTDSLTFTKANTLDCRITYVLDVDCHLNGSGTQNIGGP